MWLREDVLEAEDLTILKHVEKSFKKFEKEKKKIKKKDNIILKNDMGQKTSSKILL